LLDSPGRKGPCSRTSRLVCRWAGSIVPMLVAYKAGPLKVKRRINTFGLMPPSRSPEVCLTPGFHAASVEAPLLRSDVWPPCAERSRRIYGFGVSGLACSANLPPSNSVGDDEFPCLSAPWQGELIASYQPGYGTNAFGVGPLRDIIGLTTSRQFPWLAALRCRWLSSLSSSCDGPPRRTDVGSASAILGTLQIAPRDRRWRKRHRVVSRLPLAFPKEFPFRERGSRG
jgi:hypothetical protein